MLKLYVFLKINSFLVMRKCKINILMIFVLLVSCNNYHNKENNLSLNICLKNNELKNEKIIDSINKKILAEEFCNDTINNSIVYAEYSYLANDTLYITNKNGLPILQYYLPNYHNKSGDLAGAIIFSIIETIYDNFLYINIYVGDVLPYKAILFDLNTKKIIFENDRYQFYLGHSVNGLYHLFSGGSLGSVGFIAVFDSKNDSLNEMQYYASVFDTNQLKWFGNEFFYYSDIDKKLHGINKWSEKTSSIKVQKYLWKENITLPLNEFTEAFIE